MIGRSVLISLTMKSKKAETRGVCRNAGVVSMREIRLRSATGSIIRTRSGSASPRAVGNGATPTPALAEYTRPSALLQMAGEMTLALAALLGAQIAVLVLTEGLINPFRAAARLRVLASSGAQRTALMPDVPTLVEQGHADLVVREWFAFFMSGKASPERVDAGSKALQDALARPQLVAQFQESGMVAASSNPAALATRIAAEQRYRAPALPGLGVRVE